MWSVSRMAEGSDSCGWASAIERGGSVSRMAGGSPGRLALGSRHDVWGGSVSRMMGSTVRMGCDSGERDVNDPGRNDPGRTLDRAELAEAAGVPAFIADLVIDAGLIAPVESAPAEFSSVERFDPAAVDMLAAARTLVDEGVAVEELAALAMRHATHVESVIDDAIELFERHRRRDGRDPSGLSATLNRLAPVVTDLVAKHFERTLMARAINRAAGAAGASAGAVVVCSRRLDRRVDPLAVYAAAADFHRSLWLRPDAGAGMAAVGAVEVLEPSGPDRFSAASAARAVLAARVRRHGPASAPAPVLVGGFSFRPGPDPDPRPPDWTGFGDCKLVLPELTVIDRPDGTWAQKAARVGPDGDESAAVAALDRELAALDFTTTATALDRRLADSGFSPSPPAGGPFGSASRGPARQIDGGAGGARPSPSQSPKPGCDDGCDDPAYLELVAEGIAAVDLGELDKVVCARMLALAPGPDPATVSMATGNGGAKTLSPGPDLAAVLDALRRRNPNCAVFAFTDGAATFLGATPEELAVLDGHRLCTSAVAGTAARGTDGAEDARLADELRASAKERAEHQFVVEAITAGLEDLGLVDPTPTEPEILALANLQHLRTPITSRVRQRSGGVNDMDVLRVAGVLHPTPATGGAPLNAALAFIEAHETFDRGWYAAPVGWCDLDGNGELRVALRSMLVADDGLRLFAGAGVVAGSTPAGELAETSVKLRALLDAIEDTGADRPTGLRPD